MVIAILLEMYFWVKRKEIMSSEIGKERINEEERNDDGWNKERTKERKKERKIER